MAGIRYSRHILGCPLLWAHRKAVFFYPLELNCEPHDLFWPMKCEQSDLRPFWVGCLGASAGVPTSLLPALATTEGQK